MFAMTDRIAGFDDELKAAMDAEWPVITPDQLPD